MSVKKQLEALLQEVDPSKIQVVAVSKYATLEQILEAYACGLRHFGESKLQVALAKRAFLPKDIIWHFIGPIQSNKAASIAKVPEPHIGFTNGDF